jgi:hypothetical protein
MDTRLYVLVTLLLFLMNHLIDDVASELLECGRIVRFYSVSWLDSEPEGHSTAPDQSIHCYHHIRLLVSSPPSA